MTRYHRTEPVEVYFWPDGVWCAAEEKRDLEVLFASKSDDFYVGSVSEWDSDGSPAPKYFDGSPAPKYFDPCRKDRGCSQGDSDE